MSQDRAQWRRKISEWSPAVANPHRGRSTSEWVSELWSWLDPLIHYPVGMMKFPNNKVYSARHRRHTRPGVCALWSSPEINRIILGDGLTHPHTDGQTHVSRDQNRSMTNYRIGPRRTTSDLSWARGSRNDRIGPMEIHSHLKNVRVLITQTQSVTLRRNRPTRLAFFFETGTTPYSWPYPTHEVRGAQRRGPCAQFKSHAVISHSVKTVPADR